MSRRAAITGWGHYLPERVLTNRELEATVGTTDEWILSRTGISERRIAGPVDTTSSMCAAAASEALEGARLDGSDLDLVICATTTPDHLLPATGCLVRERIRAHRAGAFDLNAACTGFLYGLSIAAQFIENGTYGRVLVVAGEILSRFVNWKDRNTCVLFGDGAGAVVLEAVDGDCGVMSTVLGCQGDTGHLLTIEAGASSKPATAATLESGAHFINMRGHDVFRLAVRSMSEAAREAMRKAGISFSEIRAVIPHQANERIITATREALGMAPEKFFINLNRYGNSGAASLPLALSEYASSTDVREGDNLVLTAFGGGFTWAAAVVRWANVPEIIASRVPGIARLSAEKRELMISPDDIALAG